MSDYRPFQHLRPSDAMAFCSRLYGGVFAELVLCSVICNSQVLAADLKAAGVPNPVDPVFTPASSFTPAALFTPATPFTPAAPFTAGTAFTSATSFTPATPSLAAILPLAGNFTAPTPMERNAFSATDFSPRRHSPLDSESNFGLADETPMLRGTTVWQRMAEYRSRDRVRLLTLWESSGSSVSLQASKRGDPSLQWTSRFMNRGGSTRGLLDQLFSVSLSGAGNRLRGIGRSTSTAQEPTRQASLAPAAKNTQ